MKHIKRNLLLSVCAFTTTAMTMARDVSYLMQVALSDGTTESYLVADHPVVTFDQQFVTITCQGLVANYKTDEVLNYTFVPSQMGDANVDGVINLQDITDAIGAYISEDNSNISIQLVDFDGDGKLTVADITSLIELYLVKEGKRRIE